MSKPLFTAEPVKAEIAGIDFTFTPDVMAANNYINEMTMENKVVPARTYLMRSVDAENKDNLALLLDSVPGLIMELYQTVSNKAKGDITITLKN
ncbi:putative phage tail assembly chaperone [Vibrio kyushuensis]|uniref:putative phage tail assembly chaperone n=1 Tax=Vibrio kyushuensis TaxID=2910249 RepID=UPI003D0AD045